MRTKRVQIRDHGMKILDAPDHNTIFLLREMTCHPRILSFLKSFEKLLAQKKTIFQKSRSYGLGYIKKELINQKQMIWSQLSAKILGVQQYILVTQKQLRH